MILTTLKGKNYITGVLTLSKPPHPREVDLRMMILLYVRHEPQDEEDVVEVIKEASKGKFSEEEIREAVDQAVRQGYVEEFE